MGDVVYAIKRTMIDKSTSWVTGINQNDVVQWSDRGWEHRKTFASRPGALALLWRLRAESSIYPVVLVKITRRAAPRK